MTRLRLIAFASCSLALAGTARAGEDASVDAGPDASPDAGLDASPDAGLDAAPDAEVGEDSGDGCGRGPACGPGLDCIAVDDDFFCGICAPGDARSCDVGCGEGRELCEADLFWSGRCEPFQPVDCLRGDTRSCDSSCGPGTQQCAPSTCTWEEECVADGLIQCLPNTTSVCSVGGGLCPGTMQCNDDCTWGTCEADDDCRACGDGDVDEGEGEHCDDGNTVSGDGCSFDCQWEDAPPFKSLCDCRSTPGLPSPGAGLAALGLLGFLWLLRPDLPDRRRIR